MGGYVRIDVLSFLRFPGSSEYFHGVAFYSMRAKRICASLVRVCILRLNGLPARSEGRSNVVH